MVLYRKYRPQVFAQVVGQDHIRGPLLAQLSSGKIPHAYLFAGPRGTGKTSVARILAKAVNCQGSAISDQRSVKFGEPCDQCESCTAIKSGTHLDLIEIDAASNRGIDEIRDLREKIKLSPALSRFKVYIIDEAHMLTTEAFNALLKTLEEPPEHAIFVLATTEPQKVPATIISRTSRFDFKVPNVPQIKEKLGMIGKAEGWNLKGEVLEEVAKRAAGAFRDAEVLLEKVASVDSSASLEKTREILGKKESSDLVGLLNLIEEGETKRALVWLNESLTEGGGVRILTESILEALRKIILIKVDATNLLEPITEEELAALRSLAAKISKPRLLKLTGLFNKAIDDLREATIPQLPLELAIVEATSGIEERSATIETAETTKAQKIAAPDNASGVSRSGRATTENTESIETPLTTETQKETETLQPETTRTQKKAEAQKTVTTETQKGLEAREESEKIKEDKLLKKLQKNWGEFLKKLKPVNSSIELFLRNAKPVDLDEDLLTIEFDYRFHKEKVEERKYRELVEDALAKVAGKLLRIKGVVGAKPPAKKPPVAKPRPEEKEDIDPAEVFSKLE
ncbi:MAG: DNA polymerase III, subunit gamma and tau [Candidatus Woykebacteria bacterium GWB1_45_5]|uniref:DNA polymerase III subunit gamma/tau n=2 Tax=Candidatus Woykeibacteriota TaxID=1817899 RepID=A0A1G1W391_9BACT|nr:MAG: DNA polymerase III, subunit gamma and tau [Candidatus Woykebacteria bacterium GWA1_44_8]OGY23271.1 MAG: DNA polymerase III, subunit gamma and tau [Candidatus Woykebacteria bacterium GWB1_45_5]